MVIFINFINRMATFFGEVVFPVSRAFWDDEDENRAIDYSVNQL